MHEFWLIADEQKECPESYHDHLLMAITVSASVLFCLLAGFFLRILVKVTDCLAF